MSKLKKQTNENPLREAKEAFRNSEKNYKMLLQYAPTAIYEIDLTLLRFVSVNNAMCKITGYAKEQLLAMSPLDLLEEESRNRFHERISKRVKEERTKDRDDVYEVKTKSGQELWVKLSVGLIHKNRNTDTALVVVHDITEAKKAEDAKDNFISVLAHELRNPLAPLMSSIQLLHHCVITDKSEPQRRRVDPLVRESLVVADRQMRNMAKLLDDLLDVSRIIHGKIQLKMEKVDLSSVLKEAAESSYPQIKARRHNFSLSLPSESLIIRADPVRLEQIVVNLLNNAAKYTDPSGNIWLSAKREGNKAVIKIKDNGTGISPEKVPLIFQPFFQMESKERRTSGGLGIGLSLVKNLSELQGGNVSVSSDGSGKGSEFTVKFPVLPPNSTPKTNRLSAKIKNIKKKILVVDDNIDITRMTAKLLQHFGHEVCKANDGPSAIETAKKFQPDIILLDIGLPVMDGYEVAKELRKIEKGWQKKLVLAAISGYGQEDDKKKSKEAGFDYHFVKPLEIDAIMKLIKLKR